MRVEGQGMAVDYRPAKGEVKGVEFPRGNNRSNEKIGLKDIKVEQRPEQQSPEQRVNKEALQEAVKTANDAIKFSNYHLQFRLHEASGRYQVKVLDSVTEEVIREIPAESILEFSANIKRMLDEAVGFFVDETV